MRPVRAHAVAGLARQQYRVRYAKYMASAKWAERRRVWIVAEEQRTGAEVVCAICGGPWEDLHHMDYERLGAERHSDLVALCREHHDWIHRAYESGRWRSVPYAQVMQRLLATARRTSGEGS